MNDRARIYYTDQTMNDLARKLSRYSRTRVVDRTSVFVVDHADKMPADN